MDKYPLRSVKSSLSRQTPARTDAPDDQERAEFARKMTLNAFGRHGQALDQGNFVDRLPDQIRLLANGRLAT